MSKKKPDKKPQTSAGKGDTYRSVDRNKWNEGYEKAFKKPKKKKN